MIWHRSGPDIIRSFFFLLAGSRSRAREPSSALTVAPVPVEDAVHFAIYLSAATIAASASDGRWGGAKLHYVDVSRLMEGPMPTLPMEKPIFNNVTVWRVRL